jgi:hypothetical protein
MQAIQGNLIRDEFGQAGLKDGHFGSFQGRDAISVYVAARNVMPQVGKAGTCGQANIASAQHY